MLAVVALPARNERDRIAACLASLTRQDGLPAGSYGILVFLNNCTDDTQPLVDQWATSSSCPVRVLYRDHAGATAGWARRSAMEAAAGWLAEEGADDGVILTTDADSRVGTTWIADNLACVAAGADAVAGRITLDPDEASLLPPALHARGRLEGEYEALLTELGARLDPEPWNPWPCHWTTSGATIAVRRTIYNRVGGMPALVVGEDRAFIAAVRRHDAFVRHAPHIEVITSGRLEGRAPGGAADTMRLRCDVLDSPCDERLEPVRLAIRRVLWRRRLRLLHLQGRLADVKRWARPLGFDTAEAAKRAGGVAFGQVFSAIENTSPSLVFHPLRPTELPGQIRWARYALDALRLSERFRPAGRPDDTASCVTDAGPARSQLTS